MFNNEKLSEREKTMKLILYFSPSNSTRYIAEHIGKKLNLQIFDITSYNNSHRFDYSKTYEYLILCFPVYSQNIPTPVKGIIKKLQATNFVLIATYGRMGMGNVLNEAADIIKGKIVGGAYIPTKHTYNDGNYFSDFNQIDVLLEKIKNEDDTEVIFPKLKKNIFSNFFPNVRSRIGVKIRRTNDCINCSICNEVCPTNSINNGIIKNKCIRCLSCYTNCPYNGLVVGYRAVLKSYIKHDKVNRIIVYC